MTNLFLKNKKEKQITGDKDSEANIFKEASFGVVGDWEKVLPSFTATVQELLSS